jgi:hypothetical protein
VRTATAKAPRGARPDGWPIRAARALEEHHLSAFSRSRLARRRFVLGLAPVLAGIESTQVCLLDGAGIIDLASLCRAVERSAGVGSVAPSLDGPGGVQSAVRRRPEGGSEEGPALRRRYFIWSDAHVLLKADSALFGRAVDTLTGVSAETELVGDDLLLLQRVVLVGDASLDVYAEDPRGQLQRWWSDGPHAPLWQVVTGLAGPPVLRWRIGADVLA